MALVLLIPFLLVRFALLGALSKDALKRAAYFAPLSESERVAYWVYQISNAAILIYLLFLRIEFHPSGFFIGGVVVYSIGLALLVAAVLSFAAPLKNGMSRTGLYRVSRNPMYVVYFVFFVGCAMLTQSAVLLAIVIVFQVSAHWIIRSEERWCIEQFGEEYLRYREKVRRYL